MNTKAQQQLALIEERPHASTRREILRNARIMYDYVDDGETERFAMPDGSFLIFNHYTNDWSATDA